MPLTAFSNPMSKAAKKGRKEKTAGIAAVNKVADPTTVLRACLPVLKAQFDTDALGFAHAPLARRVSRYELQGPAQQTATARDKYAIHLLCSGACGLYWAAVVLDFKFVDPTHDLVNVEIVVFTGAAYGSKVPFLRAEWHCSPADLAERHAQPHWHAYVSTPSRTETHFAQEPVAEFRTNVTPSEEQETVASIPFHFAMSSSWQKGDQHAHREPVATVLALQNWLNGCLYYIRSQLQ